MVTVSPAFRRLGLLIHVTTSVGWLGAVAAFLALAIAAVTGTDTYAVRAAYVGMEVSLTYAIVPLSIATVAIAVVQSMVSPWGLLRHWWVVVKLVMTVLAIVLLLQYTQTMQDLTAAASASQLGISDLRRLAFSPIIHATGGIVVLLGANVLSVYKPRGLTPYGWRWEDRQRRRQEAHRRTPLED